MAQRFTHADIEKLARAYYVAPGSGDSSLNLRDFLDICTGGDLDCVKLDILTDRVKAAVRKLVDSLTVTL